MTVTLPPDLDTAVGQIRDELPDDTLAPKGPRPEGANFEDGTLQRFYDDEGSVMRAVARACERLAREWAKVPTAYKLGPESTSVKTAEYYRIEAARLRKLYGRPNATTRRARSGYSTVVIAPGGRNL